VRDPKIKRGLGYGLDEKALEAVSQWRFRPGIYMGTPVAVSNVVAAVNFPAAW